VSATPAVTKIPFLDLRSMNDEVRDAIEAGWRRLLDSSAFVGGQAVTEFERQFAEFVGVRCAVGVGSGTDALRIALQAVGVERGDLVITVPHTFIATVEGITQAGADPLFVDIDPVTYTMQPEGLSSFLRENVRVEAGRSVERKSGRRVSCVVPVDLYGHPCDWDAIGAIADQYRLRVVEDACQAHGATWRGAACGSFGNISAFSFYPGKNLGAMGEAGAITTQDPELAARCMTLREHGQRERYIHISADGSNARLDALQAVVLSAKLVHLQRWNDARRRAAATYRERLADLDVVLPQEAPGARHVYHLFVVQVDDRDRVRRALDKAGIGTGLHYPVPLHLQVAYHSLGQGYGAFPASEGVAAAGLSLPMFPHISDDQIESITRVLEETVGKRRSGAGRSR